MKASTAPIIAHVMRKPRRLWTVEDLLILAIFGCNTQKMRFQGKRVKMPRHLKHR